MRRPVHLPDDRIGRRRAGGVSRKDDRVVPALDVKGFGWPTSVAGRSARLNALDPPDLVIELPDTTLDENDELSSLRLAQVAEFAVVEIQQRRSQDPTILLQELQGRIGRHDLP